VKRIAKLGMNVAGVGAQLQKNTQGGGKVHLKPRRSNFSPRGVRWTMKCSLRGKKRLEKARKSTSNRNKTGRHPRLPTAFVSGGGHEAEKLRMEHINRFQGMKGVRVVWLELLRRQGSKMVL